MILEEKVKKAGGVCTLFDRTCVFHGNGFKANLVAPGRVCERRLRAGR